MKWMRHIWLLPLLAVLLLLATGIRARAEEARLPDGITCEQVRETVARLGKVKALALAIQHGASVAQIRAARRCLR